MFINTGHTQYWKQDDHLLFLKVREKYTSIPTMVLEIRKKCPDLTAAEIVNHEAWYKVYIDLREKQKNCVKEWRKRKELEKIERTKSLQSNVANESTKPTETSQIGIQDRKPALDGYRTRKMLDISKGGTNSDDKIVKTPTLVRSFR